MKIKRFVASDMRQAMARVRDEQGPDAVILSSRRLAEGIEIIAAIDYDEALIREAAGQAETARTQEPEGDEAVAATPPAAAPAAAAAATRAPRAASRAAPAVPPRRETPAARSAPRAMSPRDATATPAAATAAAAVENASLLGMKQELRELRGMLESQLSSLAWNDLGRRKPLSARMLRELSRLGIDADVAGAIVADLPEHISPEQARYLPLGLLSRKLPVNAHDFLDDGGVVALLGATGVGKTTTLAKLAARYVMRHGLKGVALVTTDDFRIGAEEQLFHYGRLLGVPVYSAGEPAALCALMERLADQRLVLIDTPGMACRDARVAALMHGLRETRTPVRNTLVLAANAQAAALDEALRAYAPFAPAGCILTKLDEAPTLGGALSALIRHRLPVDYSTDGQRVPEDIARADAHRLVCRAVKANTPAPPLDDFALAERFGRVAVAFA